MPEDKKQLTDREALFLKEYFLDRNATQAVIRAGLTENEASAAVMGHKLLRSDNISEILEAHDSALYEEIGFTQRAVARQLTYVGQSDIRKLLTPEGHMVPIHELDDATAASISSVELVTNPMIGEKDDEGRTIVEHTHKIKLWPKLQALDQIAKHLGCYTDKSELKVTGLTINIGDKDADCC